MSVLKRLLCEPLVHFLVIGSLVFIAFSSITEPAVDIPTQKQVTVTTDQVSQLAERFRKTWRRSPSHDELSALVDNHVRQEILIQEALSLSMDKGDAVIKRRLAQKMEFLLESAAGAQVPTDAELREFFEANRLEYATEPLVAFEQVFIGELPDNTEVLDVLAALSGGAAPELTGRQTLLPPSMDLSTLSAIDGTFGPGFFSELETLEVGGWTAPIRSGFGIHAVRITERQSGRVPELEALRDRVQADWRASNSREVAKTLYAEMRAGYAVTMPTPEELQDVLQ